MKTCSKCRKEQPLIPFYGKRGARGTISRWCRDCYREYHASRYSASPETFKEKSRQWYRGHKEQVNLRHRKWIARNREWERESRLIRIYGITKGQYDAILTEQGGACPIGNHSLEGHKLHVDHDHDSGDVRGILCAAHNKGLGHFQDEPSRLIDAATYVTRNRAWDKQWDSFGWSISTQETEIP